MDKPIQARRSPCFVELVQSRIVYPSSQASYAGMSVLTKLKQMGFA